MSLLRSVSNFEWNSMFFSFSLIVEGTTEMVLQFILSPKAIYNKSLGFIEQKMYLWTNRKVRKIRNLLIDIIYLVIFFWWTFQSCSWLMFVLNKGALFHYNCYGTTTKNNNWKTLMWRINELVNLSRKKRFKKWYSKLNPCLDQVQSHLILHILGWEETNPSNICKHLYLTSVSMPSG